MMSKDPRYLITTADERTWKFDRPVIFLGEWCCQYERRHIWQKMDAIVAAPYGVGKEQKDADHKQVLVLEDKLFPMLCISLNWQHGTEHDSKYWKIVIGHWLRRYIEVLINRVNTLEQCLQAHQISGMTAFSDECYSLATKNSYDSIWAFNDDYWNCLLYVRILILLGKLSFPVEVIASDSSTCFCWIPPPSVSSLKKRILRWGYRHIVKLTATIARSADAFIINSYLPKSEVVKLHLVLGQVPQMWASPNFMLTKRANGNLRQKMYKQLGVKENEAIFRIMSTLIFELMPVSYLEGYEELNEIAKALPWPKNPKFIFTSNNFDTDDLFKLWAATKNETGIPYIIGQHGNQYGTDRYRYPTIDEVVADKFITWGWTDGLQQHIPAFVLKTVGQKKGAYDPEGGGLLIELILSQRLFTWDVTAEFNNYFRDQRTFLECLKKPIKAQFTIRLPPANALLRWCDEERWKEFDGTLKQDSGIMKINELITQSRLIIHSYDSTGILETLSQDIPTIAFWQNDFDHLRDSAKPYYQLLVDAGIVHLTPESAAAKVNEVWDDVEGWWAQSAVQEARKKFCDRYARVSQNPIQNLKKLLQA